MSNQNFGFQFSTVKLLVEVSASDALAGGKVAAGRVAWDLTPEVVEALSPEDRALFAAELSTMILGGHSVVEMRKASGFTGAVTVTDPDITPESLAAAIRAECAAIRAKREALTARISARPASAWIDRNGFGTPSLNYEAAEFLRLPGAKESETGRALDAALAEAWAHKREADRVLFLQRPITDLLEFETRRGRTVGCRAKPLSADIADDETRAHHARVVQTAAERDAKIQADLAADGAREEAERAEAERDRKKAEEKKAAEAAQVARDEVAIREFARGVPELAQAAREEYEVANGVLDVIAAQVAAKVPPGCEAVVVREGSGAHKAFIVTDAKSPRAARFETRDALCVAVAAIPKPATGVTVRVGKVVSIRQRADDRDDQEYRGAVVTVRTTVGAADRVVFVRFPG